MPPTTATPSNAGMARPTIRQPDTLLLLVCCRSSAARIACALIISHPSFVCHYRKRSVAVPTLSIAGGARGFLYTKERASVLSRRTLWRNAVKPVGAVSIARQSRLPRAICYPGYPGARRHNKNTPFPLMGRGQGDRLRPAVPQQAHLGAGGQQAVERALGLDVAVLQHNDVVGALQRRPPVRNHQTRRRLAREDALPESVLRLHIQRAGKIVEDQQFWLLHEHTRRG